MAVIAYLGPSGTHSEAALKEFSTRIPGGAVTPLPCFSSAEAFAAVCDGRAAAALVPLENMIQGPVAETLDLLLLHRKHIAIRGTHLTTVRHAVGVLPECNAAGSWPDAITEIFSHEQALRQCRRYIGEKLPNAATKAEPSTGAAVDLVAKERRLFAAAIGPAAKIVEAGLIVMHEDASDVPGNKTRFALIAPAETKFGEIFEGSQFVTSIVVDPGRDRQGLLFEILQVISVEHRINLLSIHSRPDTKGGFVFHIDLEGRQESPTIATCLKQLRDYCLQATGETAEISIFGSYARVPFDEPPLRTVAIIGGSGTMGKWFAEFFSRAGIAVRSFDVDTPGTVAEVVKGADVVLLSVPMSSIQSVIAELKPHLEPEQLVVENCSIKNCALPMLGELPASIEVLGIHTMFADHAHAPRGENIVLTRTPSCGKKAKALEDLFYKFGANLSHTSSAEHDQRTAFLQSLLQLNMIALGEVLAKSFADPSELEVFSTPNSRNIMSAMHRVLSQKDELIRDLQLLNDHAPQLRHRLLESLFRLVSAFDRDEVRPLDDAVTNARRFFKIER